MKYLVIILLNFVMLSVVYGEYNIKKSEKEYSIGYEEDGLYRILTFYKENEKKAYSKAWYRVSKMKAKDLYLQDEIKIIDKLWMESLKEIEIEIDSINIGVPKLYADIFSIYIETFLKSEKWMNSSNKNEVLMREIIKESKIYKSLEEFLFVKSYKIKEFSTEKHGFISKETLLKKGKTGNEKILMPYMLWIKLEKMK